MSSFLPFVREKLPEIEAPLPNEYSSPAPPRAPNASILYLPVWGTIHSWIPCVLIETLFAKLVATYSALICCCVGPKRPVAPAFVKVKISVGSELPDCEPVW